MPFQKSCKTTFSKPARQFVKILEIVKTIYILKVAPKGLIPFIKTSTNMVKRNWDIFLRKLIYDYWKEIEPGLKRKDLKLLFTEHHKESSKHFTLLISKRYKD